MFQFKPISPRIQTLRDKRANAKTYMDAERTKIYTDYYKTHENEPNDLNGLTVCTNGFQKRPSW